MLPVTGFLQRVANLVRKRGRFGFEFLMRGGGGRGRGRSGGNKRVLVLCCGGSVDVGVGEEVLVLLY